MLESLAPNPTLDERVYKELRRAIVSSALQPGQEVVVTSVAGQLGVSRIPVMHACQRLAGEGFLIANPRRSFVVAPMTESRIVESYAVLVALESVAVDGAARAATPALVRRWRQLKDEALAFRLRHAETEMNSADVELHRAIWDAAGMPYVGQLLRVVFDHLEPSRALARLRREPERSAAEHEALIDALAHHDTGAAQAAVRAHRGRGQERALAALHSGVTAEVAEVATETAVVVTSAVAVATPTDVVAPASGGAQ